jgi:hypothetical protein
MVARRFSVLLRRLPRSRAFLCLPPAVAAPQPSARMRFCRTASRSQPGCCGARVPSQASHAAMSGLAMAFRFHGRHISCSDLVRNGGWTARGQICAATLKWTIVVLRDGRRCRLWRADVAQLVAHHLAKVRVAGSNPVIRSKVQWHQPQRWSGRVVRQRPAKPCTRVRFPSPPQIAGEFRCWSTAPSLRKRV